MRAVDLIQKKKQSAELTEQEIAYLIDGYTRGEIPDYQMSAWAMAVCLNGMSARETADLTMAMVASGERIDLSDISGVKVDKHSTGGVGDTTTLVLAPWVAACGVPVAKMSGRGLGHTGGTIDKLEAIPHFTTELSQRTFVQQVQRLGVAVTSQSDDITPADKQLYGLRDVTATVDSVPLIASSIMSKKIASGADAIVLDVKVGRGAFMKTVAEARELAQLMVEIGQHVGKHTMAVISRMDEPLGMAVGNALELEEAIAALSGSGPDDLSQLCLQLGSLMLVAARVAANEAEAERQLLDALASGAALDKLKQWITAQGGDSSVVDDTALLPQAKVKQSVQAEQSGWVAAIDATEIGQTAMILGAGRAVKDAPIDAAAGVKVLKKIGDRVSAGEPIAEVYSDQAEVMKEAVRRVAAAYEFAERATSAQPLIIETIV